MVIQLELRAQEVQVAVAVARSQALQQVELVELVKLFLDI
jgi:hypothetical protein